jgi:hypothetical protein
MDVFCGNSRDDCLVKGHPVGYNLGSNNAGRRICMDANSGAGPAGHSSNVPIRIAVGTGFMPYIL